jgi:hypothetical protein
MLESALVLASKGYPVFPVRLCPTACLKCDICKAPASPHGFHDATLDAERIQTLWKQHPGQLVGVPTCKISNVDVLDLDSAKHPAAVSWWMSNRQRIPHTRTHQTGSGGLHIYFRHNELARTGNGRLGEGVDVKANGGYVVWWPAFDRKIVCDRPISEWPVAAETTARFVAEQASIPHQPRAGSQVCRFAWRGQSQQRNFLGFLPGARGGQRRQCKRIRSIARSHPGGTKDRAARARSARDCPQRQTASVQWILIFIQIIW